jgi:hypothetical protein
MIPWDLIFQVYSRSAQDWQTDGPLHAVALDCSNKRKENAGPLGKSEIKKRGAFALIFSCQSKLGRLKDFVILHVL